MHFRRLPLVLAAGALLALGTLALPGAWQANAQTNPTVQTKDIGGNTGTVLTDAQGKTLYTFSLDTDGTSHCTGQCATAWPPLLLNSGNPVAPSGLSGNLGVITRSDGQRQVTYNNQPLYYFSGDSQAGQANGEGRSAFNGTWRVAQPQGAANASNGAAAPGQQSSSNQSPSSNQPSANPSSMPATGTGGLVGQPSALPLQLMLVGLAALLLSGVAGFSLAHARRSASKR
jgi:predicted lipoprotein with Yx(FWY)xxD motif